MYIEYIVSSIFVSTYRYTEQEQYWKLMYNLICIYFYNQLTFWIAVEKIRYVFIISMQSKLQASFTQIIQIEKCYCILGCWRRLNSNQVLISTLMFFSFLVGDLRVPGKPLRDEYSFLFLQVEGIGLNYNSIYRIYIEHSIYSIKMLLYKILQSTKSGNSVVQKAHCFYKITNHTGNLFV